MLLDNMLKLRALVHGCLFTLSLCNARKRGTSVFSHEYLDIKDRIQTGRLLAVIVINFSSFEIKSSALIAFNLTLLEAYRHFRELLRHSFEIKEGDGSSYPRFSAELSRPCQR